MLILYHAWSKWYFLSPISCHSMCKAMWKYGTTRVRSISTAPERTAIIDKSCWEKPSISPLSGSEKSSRKQNWNLLRGSSKVLSKNWKEGNIISSSLIWRSHNVYPDILVGMTFQLSHFLKQKRGLDDKKMLPNFPYRDDCAFLLMAIERMVQDYVNKSVHVSYAFIRYKIWSLIINFPVIVTTLHTTAPNISFRVSCSKILTIPNLKIIVWFNFPIASVLELFSAFYCDQQNWLCFLRFQLLQKQWCS